MNRRVFVKSMAAAGVSAFAGLPLVQAALPKMKIRRVRAYAPPRPNPLFNQADTVIKIPSDCPLIDPTLIDATIEECTAGGQGTAVQYARWSRSVLLNGLGRYQEAMAAAQEASDGTAETAAQRLVQLPPEALVGLSSRTDAVAFDGPVVSLHASDSPSKRSGVIPRLRM